MTPRASIVITTRNRRQELEKAVASALAQKLEGGVETIVVDDGSTDGTAAMIAEKFPAVKLHRFEQSKGYIVQRNYGAHVAAAPIIFSIDDDACFSTETIVADILGQFDREVIGAVAIPFINVCQDAHRVMQQAPDDSSVFICPSYIGTAHALRRDLFLELGGYREALFHQGEEGDYCLRLLKAGYVVRLGRSDPIHHFESPRRDFRRVDLYGRRNNVLFGWYHVPTRVLPAYLAATTWNGLHHGLTVRRPGTMIEGLLQGYRSIWTERTQRAPASMEVFRLYRHLVARQAVPLSALEERLARLCPRAPVSAPAEFERAGPMPISITITTKNRLEDLRRTCAVLSQLSPPPLEIIITADGCSDGTIEFVKTEMPGARLIINEKSLGSVASRDRMIREARGELVFILDDDSYPQQPDCLARIGPLFQQRPRMAVLHFPQCTDEYPETLPFFDFGRARLTRSFSNAGAVLRRSTYLRLRGFEPFFFHAYEEPDYALQCIAAGQEIFYSPAIAIRHHYSATSRSEWRTHQRHARNEFWSTLIRVPFPYVLPVAAYRAFSQLCYACSRGLGWIVREPAWWFQAAAQIPRCLRLRQPVRWADYQRWLRLPDVSYPPVWSRAATTGRSGQDQTGPECIIVAQLGARMHYAVPRLLDRSGLLERLYTDICARKNWPQLLRVIPSAFRPAGVQRLLGRDPQGIAAKRITAFTGFGFDYARRLARARTTDERNATYLWSGREFCRQVVARGFGNAGAVYVFNSAGLEILQAARSQGLKGILEQTIAPRSIEWRVLMDEARRFPDWEAPTAKDSLMEDYCRREAAEWAEADLVVCGSDFVREGIIACGGESEKCVVVPYGLERQPVAAPREKRRPGPLRVLTVGAVCLRKGAPYLLAAAQQLGARAEFRLVGAIEVLPAAERQLRAQVQLTGAIPRGEVAAQYDWADVFLLPSLCEGSATSTYEAMFQGRPVICTPETGSVVRDGLDGFVVPARDAGAVAEKLNLLADDPALLAEMSARALERSADFTVEHYGRRLIAAFREREVI